MILFHSVRSALLWLSRDHDGLHSSWADPDRPTIPHTAGREERHLAALAIQRALDRLPAPQQRVLRAHYLEELPVLDIAARWDRHPSCIYGRLARARSRLADQLRAEGLLPDVER